MLLGYPSLSTTRHYSTRVAFPPVFLLSSLPILSLFTQAKLTLSVWPALPFPTGILGYSKYLNIVILFSIFSFPKLASSHHLSLVTYYYQVLTL
jgi:hypothetical protein